MFSLARWRLTIIFTIALVLILGISGFVVYLTTHAALYGQANNDLRDRATRDQEVMGRGPGFRPSEGRGPGDRGFDERAFGTEGYFFALVDTSGGIIGSSPSLDTTALASTSELDKALTSGEAFVDSQSSNGTPLRLYVLPVTASDGSEALLQVGRSTAPEESALSQLRTVLLAVLAVSIVPAVAGSYALSGRVLRPIKAAVDSQRTFIADASHELKTPIAVVRTNAELLERHLKSPSGPTGSDAVVVSDILSESERLGKMVDQMLTLAQADAGVAVPTTQDVYLHEVTEEVGRSMRALAEGRGLNMQVDVAGPAEVRGSRERLRELLVILVDNAIKYTEPGGRIGVTLHRKGRNAVLTVTDTGHGIPAESLPHIFDRFYRVDKARSRESGGTGLGLAIARQIVEAHGGTIGIQSQVDKGTTVTVELRARSKDGQPEHAAHLSESAGPADR